MDPAIASLFRLDFEGILADPIRLGIFLELAETIIRARASGTRSRHQARPGGKEIPGWSLVRREGNRFVESGHVQELLLECPTKSIAGASGDGCQNSRQRQREPLADALCNTIGRPMARKPFLNAGQQLFEETGHREATTNK